MTPAPTMTLDRDTVCSGSSAIATGGIRHQHANPVGVKLTRHRRGPPRRYRRAFPFLHALLDLGVDLDRVCYTPAEFEVLKGRRRGTFAGLTVSPAEAAAPRAGLRVAGGGEVDALGLGPVAVRRLHVRHREGRAMKRCTVVAPRRWT